MNQYAVIVDFSHLFHLSRAKALDAGPTYDLTETTITNVIGKLRTIKRHLEKEQIVGYDLVFVEDRVATRKLALLPTYKEGHTDLSEDKNKVKQYLLENGSITRFCYSEGNEADDAIASVLQLALAQGDLSCIVVTSDKDLWQLIQLRVQIYNPIKQLMVTEADIQKAFRSLQPIHIPLYKALWGDSGDGVPNVVPRTQKYFVPIIRDTDGSLDTFKALVEERKYFLSEKSYTAYLEAEDLISRNYQLVRLDTTCPLIWE